MLRREHRTDDARKQWGWYALAMFICYFLTINMHYRQMERGKRLEVLGIVVQAVSLLSHQL